MDSPPSAAHPFGARFARPKRAAPRFVNPLRGFEFPALPGKQKWAPFGDPFLFGGGGGNRTHVRKPYATSSTCLFRR